MISSLIDKRVSGWVFLIFSSSNSIDFCSFSKVFESFEQVFLTLAERDVFEFGGSLEEETEELESDDLILETIFFSNFESFCLGSTDCGSFLTDVSALEDDEVDDKEERLPDLRFLESDFDFVSDGEEDPCSDLVGFRRL